MLRAYQLAVILYHSFRICLVTCIAQLPLATRSAVAVPLYTGLEGSSSPLLLF